MIICDDKFDGSIYNSIPNLVISVLSRDTKEREEIEIRCV